MDLLLICIGILLLLAGIIGCVFPAIPGPPLSFMALILLRFVEKTNISNQFLIIWGMVIVLVTVLDYVIPVFGTKFFGGTKFGTWGSIIGIIIGVFFGPIGIITGPFIGAVVAELIGGQNFNRSLKAGIGSFLGFLAGTMAKLVVSIILSYHFFTNSWVILTNYF